MVATEVRVDTRRVSVAVAAAGVSTFALLYAPQAVLPQLATAYRLDPGGASLSVGVATTALAVAVLPLAALSERVDRRLIIVCSVLASALLGLLLPLAPSYPVLLVLRALQGVAIAGFPGVAAAYLADQLGPGRLTSAVGAMIAGNSVGGMLGRLGVGFAAGPLGWRGALALVAGVALVFAAYAAATLPPTHPVRPAAPEPGDRGDFRTGRPTTDETGSGQVRSRRARNGSPRTGWARKGWARKGWARKGWARKGWARKGWGRTGWGRTGWGRLVAPYTVGLLGMGAFVAIYNAAGFRLTGEPFDLSPALASLVFLAYATGTASSAAAGRLVRGLGRARALVAALVVTCAGILLTLSGALPIVVAGFAVLTAGFFAAHAIANAWVAAEAPPGARGRAAGLYTLLYYLGSGAGGTLGSAVFGHFGWGWLIALSGCWLLTGMISVAISGQGR